MCDLKRQNTPFSKFNGIIVATYSERGCSCIISRRFHQPYIKNVGNGCLAIYYGDKTLSHMNLHHIDANVRVKPLSTL